MESESAETIVDLAKLDKRTVVVHEPVEALETNKFRRGADITIIKRMSWTLERAGQDPVRRDVLYGTPGIVVGCPDVNNRKVHPGPLDPSRCLHSHGGPARGEPEEHHADIRV